MSMNWKLIPETYFDIGHDNSHQVDVWVANGEDYKVYPGIYAPGEEKNQFHIQECYASLAGRIDHTSKRISIRFGEFGILEENYIDYFSKLFKSEYPGYKIWLFTNKQKKPKKIT